LSLSCPSSLVHILMIGSQAESTRDGAIRNGLAGARWLRILQGKPDPLSVRASRFGVTGSRRVSPPFIIRAYARGSLFHVADGNPTSVAAAADVIHRILCGVFVAPHGLVLRWAMGLVGLAAAFLHLLPDTQRLLPVTGVLCGVALWQRLSEPAPV
jgi:hypothetical protein